MAIFAATKQLTIPMNTNSFQLRHIGPRKNEQKETQQKITKPFPSPSRGYVLMYIMRAVNRSLWVNTPGRYNPAQSPHRHSRVGLEQTLRSHCPRHPTRSQVLVKKCSNMILPRHLTRSQCQSRFCVCA